ncbi:MAG: GPW/gp25 family protein [Candidatus Methanoperedens sp.]|nr:GPW/gp25 family protein [Candidatus Methanoperedens sp.]MCZ7361581.1 GPW/gp25 family protein [Candidatus Methanoperedens sp.]HLB71692.1 GPW/gp25 family protein [Candidatus Methanoperedens sp.]
MAKDMAKNFLGVGWKYPVGVSYDKKIAMSEYEEDIKEAIWIILGTVKGERVMRPDFGCGIHDLVFAPINTTTISMVENTVREGLTLWEPRIELIKVEVSDKESSEGKLLVSIDYRVRVTNNRFNLVYPFYLKEG